MREQKYRVWDSEKKRMSKPFNIGDYVLIWNDDDMDMLIQFASAKSGRFYFLQFTGLKDKNGVEIYEGDILSYNGITSGGKPFTRTVHFDNDKAQFRAGMYHLDMSIQYAEVIGNIHENPELLNK